MAALGAVDSPTLWAWAPPSPASEEAGESYTKLTQDDSKATACSPGTSRPLRQYMSFREPDWPPLSRIAVRDMLSAEFCSMPSSNGPPRVWTAPDGANTRRNLPPLSARGVACERSSTAPAAVSPNRRGDGGVIIGSSPSSGSKSRQRSDPLNGTGSARSQLQRRVASKGAAGALAQLYAEPDAAAVTAQRWVDSRPAPERNLRLALRTPIHSLIGPKTVRGERHRDQCRREQEQRVEQHRRFIASAAGCVAKDAPLLSHGLRRVERIEALPLPMVDTAVESFSTTPEPTAQEAAPEPEVRPPSQLSSNIEPPTEFPDEEGWNEYYSQGSRGTRGLADATSRFREIMERSVVPPNDMTRSIESLASWLTQTADSDELKTWAIFCWMCHWVKRIHSRNPAASPADVLRLQSSTTEGFAPLFSAACAVVGIEAFLVQGWAKSLDCRPCAMESQPLAEYDQNGDLERAGLRRHSWNCVKLDNAEWCLIDCACGAALEEAGKLNHSFRPHYFGTSPDELAFSHFPDDSRWQGISKPLSLGTFLNQPSTSTDVFFGHRLHFWPDYRPRGIISLRRSNTGSIQLRVPYGVRLRCDVDGDESCCFQVNANEMRKTTVKVVIVGANNLVSQDFGGKSDPYCICFIKGKPKTKFQTRSINDTNSPTWNHLKEIEDCSFSDVLHFKIYDKDFGTKDDLLGSTSLPLGRVLAGCNFNGDLELQEDGCAGSTIRVRVSMVGTIAAAVDQKDGNVKTVYFRSSLGRVQKLQISTRLSGKAFQPACSFLLQTPSSVPDFTDPFFPKITDMQRFTQFGIHFLEPLPLGLIWHESENEGELRLSAPAGIYAEADVDGDKSAAFVQRDSTTITVKFQCPPGEGHELRFHARRGDDQDPSLRQSEIDSPRTVVSSKYALVLTWRLAARPDCRIGCKGFPCALSQFQQIGAFLEAPQSGLLRPGVTTTFRIRLENYHVVGVIVETADERVHLASKGGGIFEGDVNVNGREVILLIAPVVGDPVKLLRWNVLTTSAKASVLVGPGNLSTDD